MRITAFWALAVIFAAGLIGCRQKNTSEKPAEQPFQHQECNAIYYWKTTMKLDSIPANDFMKKHKVGRAYVRFFDIVPDRSPLALDAVVPNATLQVEDSLPVSEIIPVVYITNEALREIEGSETMWATKIVERVRNMCSYNDFGSPSEIQLDCDWTQSTEQIFFDLCGSVKTALREFNPDGVVSSTIRLHQLSQTPPPVDYGVLMLYNTGSFQNPDVENSILSVDDVKPYLNKLSTYPLHLDFAYPTYSWNLVYRDNKFAGIFRGELNDIANVISPIGENRYIVSKDYIVGDLRFHKNDVIRREDSPIKTVLNVKRLIESNLKDGTCHSNILYHYDSKNLSKYTSDEIETIFK